MQRRNLIKEGCYLKHFSVAVATLLDTCLLIFMACLSVVVINLNHFPMLTTCNYPHAYISSLTTAPPPTSKLDD